MTIFLDIVTLLSFIISVVFIVVYAIRAPWWRSLFGRSLMAHVSSLTYLMVPLLLHHPFNVSTAGNALVTWIQTSALATVSATACYLLYVLIKAQIIGKK